jgi:hypothetical protein
VVVITLCPDEADAVEPDALAEDLLEDLRVFNLVSCLCALVAD